MFWQLIIINLCALLAIIFIIWWFFIAKPKVLIATEKDTTILVKDGVYQPAVIQVATGKPIKLIFIRSDPTACAEVVVFPKFNLSYSLPLNEEVQVVIPPQSKSEIDFTCQMGMFRGKIVVE